MKTNEYEYFVDIFDNSLERRLAPRESEVRLAVSVIRPEDRLPAYGYADYEKLFPLPSPKLRDPKEAEIEFLRMLDTASGTLCGDGIPVPRDGMVDIRYRIVPKAAEMAADAHDYGVGASIAVHIQVFSTQDLLLRLYGEEGEDAAGKPLSQEFQEPEVDDDDDDGEDLLLQVFGEEDEDAAGKPLSQEFQEPEVDDGDGDGDGDDGGYDGDDEQVHGSKRQRDDDDDDDDDDDEQAHGSTKRQRSS